MQKAFERNKTGEPFAAGLRFDLRFAELFRIVQVQVHRRGTTTPPYAAEEHKYPDQQPVMRRKVRVQHRIIFPIERVRVRLVLRKPLVAVVWHCWQVARILVCRKRERIGRWQNVVMAVAVITGSDIGGHVWFAQRHGFAVVGIAIMRRGDPRGICHSACRSPF